MIFVGDFSNCAVVKYINYKSESFENFQKFITDNRTICKNKKTARFVYIQNLGMSSQSQKLLNKMGLQNGTTKQ